MKRQLPGDPDPLHEPELEPVRLERRQASESDYGIFAIILAVLVILAIVSLGALVDVRF